MASFTGTHLPFFETEFAQAVGDQALFVTDSCVSSCSMVAVNSPSLYVINSVDRIQTVDELANDSYSSDE